MVTSLTEADIKIMAEKNIAIPKDVNIPIFDDNDRKINMALDYVDGKMWVAQFLKYMDAEGKKKHPTLISSDKKMYPITDIKDLEKMGF
jgi:D-Tyr-tRNAtyr deacylase